MDVELNKGEAVCTQIGLNEQLERLRDAVCCLDGVIDELNGRLECLMLPLVTNKNKDHEEKPKESRSEVFNRLSSNIDGIVRNISRIVEIKNRLDF